MALNNNSIAQAYASDFASYISVANKPEFYAKMIQQYGDGIYLMDFIHMAGDVMSISNPELTVIEEGAPERPITCSIAITAAPLDDVEITFATSDNSDEYVREGFDLIIPATYTDADGSRALRLYKSEGTWYGTPYDSTWSITSAITTAEFFLGASSWVRGSGQPEPMATGLYERSFNARLIKDSAGIEGGMLARLDWEPVKDGSGRVTSRLMTEMEFRFNSQVDSACLLSEENTNSLLTGTSTITGNSSAIGSTAGLLPTMETSAQSQSYSSAYGSTQFDAVKTLLEGQGVTSRNIKFCVGTDLMSTIENDILDWLSTNSAINPLYDGIEKAGFGVQRFKKKWICFQYR